MVGSLLYVDSKTFIEKFIHDEIVGDYYYVSVSEAITLSNTQNTASNRVSRLKSLAPPTQLVNININGDADSYYKSYMKYLASPEIFPSIVTLVRGCLSGMKIVLVYSDDDVTTSGDYCQLIGMYIKNTFGLNMYNYNYYREHKSECMKQPENMDDIIKNFYNAVDWAKTHKSEKQIKEAKTKTKEQLKSELKEMNSKELKRICKELDIVYDKSISKKEIRKMIIKKVLKRIDKQNKCKV